METKLYLITKRSKKDNKCKFNNLMHLINVDNLKECYQLLKRGKATGIDRISVEDYGKKLDENLTDLIDRMKKMNYRPQDVKRIYIPKSNGKKRPLGIPTVEDKLVQIAFARILEAIYEPDFLNCSHGFRKNRSCHTAIKQLDNGIMGNQINYVLDADISGFFDNVDHKWMIRCLEERISDKKFLRYIVRFLKSGIMYEGRHFDNNKGTPQGGVISPILANIYLHYVLDIWFKKRIVPQLTGFSFMVRYCDDFVVCFENENDSKKFHDELRQRLIKFNLSLSEEKTRLIKFSRYGDNGKPPTDNSTFSFLGFRHYIGHSRKCKPIVKHRTDGKRFNQALNSLSKWLRTSVCKFKLSELIPMLRAKLLGHYHYYGISNNIKSLLNFFNKAKFYLYKWLNRRSHRSNMTFERFNRLLDVADLPIPKIYFDLYNFNL